MGEPKAVWVEEKMPEGSWVGALRKERSRSGNFFLKFCEPFAPPQGLDSLMQGGGGREALERSGIRNSCFSSICHDLALASSPLPSEL